MNANGIRNNLLITPIPGTGSITVGKGVQGKRVNADHGIYKHVKMHDNLQFTSGLLAWQLLLHITRSVSDSIEVFPSSSYSLPNIRPCLNFGIYSTRD